MEKEVVEVATKAEETEEAEAEVEMTEDTVTMELLLSKRYCVVF